MKNNVLKREFNAFSKGFLKQLIFVDYIVSSIFTFFHFLIPDLLNSFNIRIVSAFSIFSLQVAMNSNYQVVSLVFFFLGVFSPLLKIIAINFLKKKRRYSNLTVILTYSLDVLALVVSYLLFIYNSNYTFKSLFLGLFAVVYSFVFILSAINNMKNKDDNVYEKARITFKEVILLLSRISFVLIVFEFLLSVVECIDNILSKNTLTELSLSAISPLKQGLVELWILRENSIYLFLFILVMIVHILSIIGFIKRIKFAGLGLITLYLCEFITAVFCLLKNANISVLSLVLSLLIYTVFIGACFIKFKTDAQQPVASDASVSYSKTE